MYFPNTSTTCGPGWTKGYAWVWEALDTDLKVLKVNSVTMNSDSIPIGCLITTPTDQVQKVKVQYEWVEEAQG